MPAAFLWFHKFPRWQSFCHKEARCGSLWQRHKNGISADYIFRDKITWNCCPAIWLLSVCALHAKASPDYYHLQSALKTAVPGLRPKYNIYTESRTRFVWTHLSFDQRKFRVLNRSWEQIFSRLKVCQNNFRQVLHRSKEKGEKQPILVNGIREVGTGKNIKHRNIISSKWMIIIFFSNKQNIAKIANAIQHHCTVYR